MYLGERLKQASLELALCQTLNNFTKNPRRASRNAVELAEIITHIRLTDDERDSLCEEVFKALEKHDSEGAKKLICDLVMSHMSKSGSK